jgi:hypothetical protein
MVNPKKNSQLVGADLRLRARASQRIYLFGRQYSCASKAGPRSNVVTVKVVVQPWRNGNTLEYNNLHLGKDDGFVAVNEDAVFDVPAHGA